MPWQTLCDIPAICSYLYFNSLELQIFYPVVGKFTVDNVQAVSLFNEFYQAFAVGVRVLMNVKCRYHVKEVAARIELIYFTNYIVRSI